jgi:hypothetical protein
MARCEWDFILSPMLPIGAQSTYWHRKTAPKALDNAPAAILCRRTLSVLKYVFAVHVPDGFFRCCRHA